MTLCAVAIPTRLAGTTLLGSAENAATIRLFGWKCIQLHPTILVRFSTSWIGLSIGSETKLRNWTDSLVVFAGSQVARFHLAAEALKRKTLRKLACGFPSSRQILNGSLSSNNLGAKAPARTIPPRLARRRCTW